MTSVPPTQTIFLIADLVRQDFGKKVSIHGAFAGGQILVNPGTAFPVTLSLAIYSVFEGGDGNYKVQVRVFDENRKSIVGDIVLPDVEILPNAPMQVMLNFNLFQFPSPGRYKVEILLDENVYSNDISIRVSDSPIT